MLCCVVLRCVALCCAVFVLCCALLFCVVLSCANLGNAPFLLLCPFLSYVPRRLVLSDLVVLFSNREVVWRLDIVDPQAVEHLLKSYSDILVETWRPERDAEPEFDA